MLDPLNLPKAPLDIYKINEILYVKCLLRNKKIQLTPEEWVRQHLIHVLVSEYHYPIGLISLEHAMQINKLSKRADIVVHGKDGNPVLLVECKAPHVKISTETFIQISQYNSKLKSKYVLASNGLTHIVCKIDENGEIHLKDELPDWTLLNQ